MKIRVPLLVQDIRTAQGFKIDPIEGFDPDREDFFLDGPVTKRIAILDFDPDTNELAPGARFVAPPRGLKRGWYKNAKGLNLRDAKGKEIYSPDFMAVSVFATVLKTIYLFEAKETLGRDLTWAFNMPQILVVPRAGKASNAFYHRQSHSLQFFFNESRSSLGKMIFTCLSRDIVAHETGHAIIDGIAPDLIDASAPQSLALHEGLADLTALLVAFSSHHLADYILKQENGCIKNASAFSAIAEEFGLDLGHKDGLRNLINQKNLNPEDDVNYAGDEPHELSMVLSGALYNLMIKIHENLKLEYAPEYGNKPDPLYSASGKALAKGAKRFKRMIFRALDWLPPGEISFADYGRALIAVDQVAYPDDSRMRDWLKDEFVKRSIVPDASYLDTPLNFEYPGLKEYKVETLCSSDWTAYDFVNKNRQLFSIPAGVPFEVHPRLRVEKEYDHNQINTELVFKVSWDQVEPNDLGPSYPTERRLVVGTTIVIDFKNGHILARLTNVPPDRAEREKNPEDYERRLMESDNNRLSRDAFLRRLAKQDLLRIGSAGLGPDGKPLRSTVYAEITQGIMRTRNTTNFLHIIGGD